MLFGHFQIGLPLSEAEVARADMGGIGTEQKTMKWRYSLNFFSLRSGKDEVREGTEKMRSGAADINHFPFAQIRPAGHWGEGILSPAMVRPKGPL